MMTFTISTEFQGGGKEEAWQGKIVNGGQVAEIRGRNRSTWRKGGREGREEARTRRCRRGRERYGKGEVRMVAVKKG